MKAVEAIVEARRHEAEGPMSSSAVLCRERAEALARKGEERLALEQAARSLAYLRWCDAFSEIGGCWNLRVMA